jgi:hypothetical protein
MTNVNNAHPATWASVVLAALLALPISACGAGGDAAMSEMKRDSKDLADKIDSLASTVSKMQNTGGGSASDLQKVIDDNQRFMTQLITMMGNNRGGSSEGGAMSGELFKLYESMRVERDNLKDKLRETETALAEAKRLAADPAAMESLNAKITEAAAKKAELETALAAERAKNKGLDEAVAERTAVLKATITKQEELIKSLEEAKKKLEATQTKMNEQIGLALEENRRIKAELQAFKDKYGAVIPLVQGTVSSVGGSEIPIIMGDFPKNVELILGQRYQITRKRPKATPTAPDEFDAIGFARIRKIWDARPQETMRQAALDPEDGGGVLKVLKGDILTLAPAPEAP